MNLVALPATGERSVHAARGAAFACFFALLMFLTACSGENDADTAKAYPPPDPLFYELADARGQVKGWLLGTIHALPEGVSWRTPAIDQVTRQSELLLVEVADVGASDSIAQTFAQLSYTPGLGPIEARIPSKLHPQLSSMLEAGNLAGDNFEDVEDWGAALMLARVDAPGRPEFGVDRALIAQFADREVIGFETARAQLSIFDQLAADDQRALLEGTIDEWATSRSDPERLMRAWLTGNIEALESASTQGIMSDPELRAALLLDRNAAWMKRIGPILDADRQPLIAVGAAHLVGADGLVSMLERDGYRVKRIPAS